MNKKEFEAQTGLIVEGKGNTRTLLAENSAQFGIINKNNGKWFALISELDDYKVSADDLNDLYELIADLIANNTPDSDSKDVVEETVTTTPETIQNPLESKSEPRNAYGDFVEGTVIRFRAQNFKITKNSGLMYEAYAETGYRQVLPKQLVNKLAKVVE